MNRNLGILGLLFSVFMLSCIPHKNTIYLQDSNTQSDSLQNLKAHQKPYKVQINDILNIQVKALDQEIVRVFNPVGDANLKLSGGERAYYDGFTVDLHGNIRIPILGKMNVLGYTTEEIQNMIEEKLLKDQFKETANIFVTVKLAGLRYTINGEISSPGTTTLYQERVNIFEAIANSGEIPLDGDKKDVLIIRQYPQGQKIHHLDLTSIEVMNSPYYYIQPNDIIYVKPLRQKTLGTGKILTETLGAIASVAALITTLIVLIQR